VTAEQILRAAAKYIRRHGWRQEEYGADGGPRCMAGAVRSVVGLEPDLPDTDEYEGLMSILEKVAGPNIADFNDVYCRTADDAIAALEIAADLAAPEWKP